MRCPCLKHNLVELSVERFQAANLVDGRTIRGHTTRLLTAQEADLALQQHQCHAPQRMIETSVPTPMPVTIAAPARETAALPPAPARSEVSSRSSSSGTSRAMSYKWYTATQPLKM